MTIKTIVRLWYPEVSPRESLIIAIAIRDKTWNDFKHTRFQRFVFNLLSYILKPFKHTLQRKPTQ